MKTGIKKVLVSTVAFVSLFGVVPTLAASQQMDGGYAYLNANYSGGMKKCSGGTIRENDDYSSIYVTTTYQSGSQSNYSSGVVANDASFDSGWEWSEDYSSIHKLYTSRSSSAYSTAYLSAD